MSEQNNTILNITDLSIQFKTDNGLITAVDKLNLKLKKGQVLGIVGESGSGKSVTSLATMGLLPAGISKVSQGSIEFNSKKFGLIDLVKEGESTYQSLRGNEISMIFQEPMTALNPVYTCGNQVAEAIRLHQKMDSKSAWRKTIELFELVDLPRPEDLAKAYPHELSGGQKQRVMIAMAMSCNPQILIADEPTTALDVTVQKNILELMRKLQKNHDTSIIFITHDLGVIAEVADQVLVMYRGNVIEYGPVLDIFEKPQHQYTKGLLACRPTLETTSKRLPTVSDFLSDAPNPTQTAKKVLVKKGAEPLLKIENLSKRYPLKRNLWGKAIAHVDAVKEVSFEIHDGETVGLVGESGCGKSTIGRTVLRLIDPSGGAVYYRNRNILHIPDKEMKALRSEMQIIFQDPYSALNPRISIGEAIMEPMRVHRILSSESERKKKTIELLETVNLNESHFNRYPHEFSGGQRQRISIARTLGLNPKFIICDESVSALDVSVQAQVLNLLNDLKDSFKFTYLFISHDLSVVKFMADRLIVMQKGQIEEQGSAEAIYRNPQSEYTKKLIEAIPKGAIEAIRKRVRN